MLPVTGKLEHRKPAHSEPVSSAKKVKKKIKKESLGQSSLWTQHKVCRICFALDCQLHLLIGNVKLYKAYEAVTGLTVADEEDLPPYLCTNCADQVMSCARFRHRSLQAHAMLLDIRKNHGHISLEKIQDAIKTRTHSDYDSIIEHTAKETTPVRYKKRGRNTGGVKKVINEKKISENIPVNIKKEINESNEGDNTVSQIKTKSIDVNIESEVDVNSIKKENVDVNEDGESICVNRIKTVSKSNEDCGEISNNGNKTKKSEGTTVNKINTKTKDSIEESGELKGSKIESEMTDIIRPNEIKTEIDDVQYNDITVKLELDDIDEIPDDGITAHDFSYEVPLVPSTGVNNMVKLNISDDELVNDEVDGELDTGEDSSDSTPGKEELKQGKGNVENQERDKQINKSSNTKRFHCDVCKKSFTRNSSLVAHSRVHDINNPIMCSICKKSFTRQRNLDFHMRLHTGERPFMCDVCDKTYIKKSSLEEHLLNHSGVKFKCTVCSKEFSRNRLLNLHIKRTHSKRSDNVKKFICALCNKCFSRKTTLKEHVRSHYGDRPFKCELCEKTFTRKNNLDVHMRIHSNQKPFKCQLCEKSFYLNGNLRMHMFTHSKVRPYPCHLCGKSFRLNGNLRQHLMIHSGDKPFKCNLCEDTFRQNNHLQRHLLKHANGQLT